MIEGLTDEVMMLVEQSDDGLTVAELFDRSVLANNQHAVAGAVHRLSSGGHLVRSTDKRYRTTSQAAKSAARPAKPAGIKKLKKKAAQKTERSEQKPAPKPKAESSPSTQQAPLSAAKAASEYLSAELHGMPLVSEEFVRELESAAAVARDHLDQYIEMIDDPLLACLIRAAKTADDSAEEARRALQEFCRE